LAEVAEGEGTREMEVEAEEAEDRRVGTDCWDEGEEEEDTEEALDTEEEEREAIAAILACRLGGIFISPCCIVRSPPPTPDLSLPPTPGPGLLAIGTVVPLEEEEVVVVALVLMGARGKRGGGAVEFVGGGGGGNDLGVGVLGLVGVVGELEEEGVGVVLVLLVLQETTLSIERVVRVEVTSVVELRCIVGGSATTTAPIGPCSIPCNSF
jgi:hypothetical protein